MSYMKISFMTSHELATSKVLTELQNKYGNYKLDEADVIVALGGDGFMLSALYNTMKLPLPVYGMNFGTVGFLMNDFSETGLIDRLNLAEETVINPLTMTAHCLDGTIKSALAINEVSLIRSSSQAAKLRILIDGKERMSELVCDGALVSTPAGSTAYNYSAHGPILPIGSNILALTAMAAFRPRRWRGALIPASAQIELRVEEPQKRSVSAFADSKEVKQVTSIQISSENKISYRLLFDPGHGLQERILREQFF